MIHEECEKAGMPRPVYKAGHDRICLTFISGPWSETDEDAVELISAKELTPMESRIYTAIAEGRYTTAKDMAISLGTSLSSVERATAKLRDSNRVRRAGNNRSGNWELVVQSDEKGT